MRTVIIFAAFLFCYASGRHVRSHKNGTRRDSYAGDIINLHKAFTKNEALENAKYFADLIGKVVGVAAKKTPVVGDIYSTLVELVYTFSKGEEKDIFTKVEGKVKSAIKKEITNYHFDNMFGSKMLINAIVKEKILSKDQWFMIKSQKYKFLPQLYRSIEYTKDFFPEWKAYTLVFVAATVDMISKEELDKCAIVRELKSLRSEFQNGIKALQLKRWAMLSGYDYSHKFTSDDKLYFKDGFNKNKDICKDSACNVKSRGLDVMWRVDQIGVSVVDDAKDFMKGFNEILKSVDKGGKYCFDESKCECGIKQFPKYPYDEFLRGVPSSCMGTSKDAQKKVCSRPCDTYGSSYPWCVITNSRGTIEQRNNDNMPCTKPDWDTCFKIPIPYLDDDGSKIEEE